MKKRRQIKRKPMRRKNVRKQATSSSPYSRGYAQKGGKGLLYSLIISGAPTGTSVAARDTIQSLDFSQRKGDNFIMDRATLTQWSNYLAPILDQYAVEIIKAIKGGNKKAIEMFSPPKEGETVFAYGRQVHAATARDESVPLIPSNLGSEDAQRLGKIPKFRTGLARYLFSRIYDVLGTPVEKKSKKEAMDFQALMSAPPTTESTKKAAPKETKKESTKTDFSGLFSSTPQKTQVKKTQTKQTTKKSAPKKEEVVATIDEEAIEDLKFDVYGLRSQLDAFNETFTQLEERVAKLSPQKLKNPRKISIGGSYTFFPHPYAPSFATYPAAGSVQRRKNRSTKKKKLPVKGFRKTSRKAAEGLYPSASYRRQGRYPIGDAYHARLALIYVLSPNNARARKSVIKAIAKNYPQYAWAQWWAENSKGKAGVKSWTYYLK